MSVTWQNKLTNNKLIPERVAVAANITLRAMYSVQSYS